MNDAIDRAKKAFARAAPGKFMTDAEFEAEWSSASSSWHETFDRGVRAAIATLLEPTKEMVVAGETALEDAIDSDYDSGPDGYSHDLISKVRSGAQTDVFQAMIKAALGDPL